MITPTEPRPLPRLAPPAGAGPGAEPTGARTLGPLRTVGLAGRFRAGISRAETPGLLPGAAGVPQCGGVSLSEPHRGREHTRVVYRAIDRKTGRER